MLHHNRALILALVTSVASCNPDNRPESASSKPMENASSPLIGTWIVREIETLDSAGRIIDASHPPGMIIYTPEGRMAVQIMMLPRPVVPPVPEGPDQVAAWSPEQTRRVVETYDAYFGTYEVDSSRRIVTHHVEGELRPNFVGSSYARRYEVDRDRLILSSANPNEYWRVVWQRVQHNP
jgi:hypothetical protein